MTTSKGTDKGLLYSTVQHVYLIVMHKLAVGFALVLLVHAMYQYTIFTACT